MNSILALALRRLVAAVPLIFILISLNFFLIHAAPGDPASMLIGDVSAPERVAQIRREFGLDKPVPVQFVTYVTNVAQGNLGYSYRYRVPVMELIVDRLPATLLLMGAAFAISMIVGVFLGVIAAHRHSSLLDTSLSVLALLGFSLPVFWLGMMLLLIFGVQLEWLPLHGTKTIGYFGTPFGAFIDQAKHLILPAMTISVAQLALIFRLTRGRMIEELGKDYIVQARAKGLSEWRIQFAHALRNVSLTLVTIAGLRIGVLFSGALLTEVVFAWPGIGQLMYGAMLGRDYPVIMGVFTFVVAITIISNLITDMTYGYLDPRVRLG